VSRRIFCFTTILTVLVCVTSSWAEVLPGWGKWWLPPDRSAHGHTIDSLFVWIFWITMITFVGVELLLVIFLIKYRNRPERKRAHFTHGNQRLELAWTIAPAIILAALALGSKAAWDNYRYSPGSEDPNRAKILVIGQQFKWNIIYPGPDGEFGRYLVFPKPTDAKWPADKDGNSSDFEGVPGPASLPYDKALAAINKYIDSTNHLGKDYTDPRGKDDDYASALGRQLEIPVNRTIEVQLSSKDVIHDFFLPNFRVKLDAVPGMRGRLFFTATMTSAQRRNASMQTVKLDELGALLNTAAGKNLVLVINETSPGTEENRSKDRTGWRYVNPSDRRKASIIRDTMGFGEASRAAATIQKLKDAGLTEVQVADSGAWELVCEELCGQGHNTMTVPLFVLSQEEYDSRNFDKPSAPAKVANLKSETQQAESSL
jgi:heme/copper-type cytochrome/quinol oxidase subunit 2